MMNAEPGSEVWKHRAGGGLPGGRYLPVNLVMDPMKHRLRAKLISFWWACLTHERFGSSSKPVLNGHLHYPLPAGIYKPLNEAAADKIRDYRADYNIHPSNSVSFIPDVTDVVVESGARDWNTDSRVEIQQVL